MWFLNEQKKKKKKNPDSLGGQQEGGTTNSDDACSINNNSDGATINKWALHHLLTAGGRFARSPPVEFTGRRPILWRQTHLHGAAESGWPASVIFFFFFGLFLVLF